RPLPGPLTPRALDTSTPGHLLPPRLPMTESDIASALTQFGVAGLMGWMWLTERRAAALRDKQLGEAHDRLIDSRTTVNVLLSALDQNTRALTAIEIGQRRAADLPDRAATDAPPDRAPRPSSQLGAASRA